MSSKIPKIEITPEMERNSAAVALARVSQATGIDESLYNELVAARSGTNPELAELADTILFDGFFPLLRRTHLQIINGDGCQKD